MRKAKVKQIDQDRYDYIRQESGFYEDGRLDLNDLLKRAKDLKRNEKKINLLIFFGAVSVIGVILLILSL